MRLSGRRTAAAVAATASLMLAGAASASSPQRSPRPAPSEVATPGAAAAGGVAAGGVEPWNPRRPADYAAMRAAGLTWLRTDLDWRFIEAQRGRWDWPLYDPVVRDAAAAGLHTLGILHTVPAWANGGAGDHAPPADPGLLTAYCYRTVRHYLPRGVSAYEIGNEVNLPAAGRPRPDATAYTRRFLLPCVEGVRRAAAETGRGVTVVLGSLVPRGGRNAPARFLGDVYASGGRGAFDAVALHPYTGTDAPSVSDKLTAVPDALHRVMVSHGDGGLRIWATEFGYPTRGRHSVSEQQESDFVAPALTSWYAHPYAGPLFWYCARDSGTSGRDREEHFGLLRADGSPKPAYHAVRAWFRPAGG
ncbi:hypothetical protein [Krasilnikovia sp. MM14-A1259]|uniref:hypothetical protein n=1 Tax=Krasilnikovia sp. MM14-A1259 TaxID=3373539 RepID=UPI0037FA6100